ncbi:hypothetical protein [Paenibacillus polymyxa]|uniref:hypothetical protein n=1 Tax=Paenibacillus polymyxa TaxID=1406 RepID=UPI002AB56EA8|nr:hypothetical protein [Paenibacillus polymyxa]MDY8021129.1 hypothetical protein [Paenibacillus polymyxa]
MKNRMIKNLLLLFTYILGYEIFSNLVSNDWMFFAGSITAIIGIAIQEIWDIQRSKSL